MHLERRQVVHIQRVDDTASTGASALPASALVVGAAVGAVCAIALVAGLLTLAFRRRHRTSVTEEGLGEHMRKESKSDHGSPINLRATAAFQNIWQSVDLGRNSLPHALMVKGGTTESAGLQAVLAGMHPPAASSNHASTDSSGSSTAVASRTSAGRRNSLLNPNRNSAELLDGYAAAQGGFDPDAQPLHASSFSLHDEPTEATTAAAQEEDDGCDLGEMAVVVVAGGEEVSQVLEGMQLAEFYVQQQGAEDTSMHVLEGCGYDSAPSPLYNEFSAGDAW